MAERTDTSLYFDGYKLGKTQKFFVIIAALTYAFDMMDLSLFNIVAPILQANYGITNEHIATLNMLFFGGAVLGSIIGGQVSDKIGRKLDAMMITADENTLLILSGTGEVIEPDEGVCAIGSGGNYALAAARALYQETDYDAATIAKKALKIASEICVFTNDNIRLETVGTKGE